MKKWNKGALNRISELPLEYERETVNYRVSKRVRVNILLMIEYLDIFSFLCAKLGIS